MDYFKAIYWHEGLFLRPQHFQQQDYYQQNYSYGLTHLVSPYLWGVKSLSIVQPTLDNQLLEIKECELLFADGSHVVYPGNAVLKTRSFEGLWDASGKPMPVYIGLRKLNPGRQNASTEADQGETEQKHDSESPPTRFCVPALPTPTYDLYNENKQEDLLFLAYNLQIFVGNEVAKATIDYHLIKIAELQRFGNEVKISDQYIPPLLTVKGSPMMAGILREIKEQLTARGRELSLYKRDKGLESIELGSRDMIYLLALLTLNRYIPLLHHLLEDADVSPWHCYALLRQILGELSTYTANYDVFGGVGDKSKGALPAYQHEDLGKCFSTAATLIIKLMDELTAGPDYIAPLLFDGTYFYSDVNDKIFQGNNRYYLCVRTQLPHDEIANALQTFAKLSSKEHLPILIARALPGVAIEYDTSPPTELPRSSERIYFRLDHHGEAWDAIREGVNMAIYFDSSPGDIEVELMVTYGSR